MEEGRFPFGLGIVDGDAEMVAFAVVGLFYVIKVVAFAVETGIFEIAFRLFDQGLLAVFSAEADGVAVGVVKTAVGLEEISEVLTPIISRLLIASLIVVRLFRIYITPSTSWEASLKSLSDGL